MTDDEISAINCLKASPLFEFRYYSAQAGIVFNSVDEAAEHYFLVGWPNRIDPSSLFRTDWYLQQYQDIREDGINPLLHYVTKGWAEGRRANSLFHSGWYQASYADAAGFAGDPLVHYAQSGARQGCEPCPLFDSAWYREQNPELDATGLTVLGHYLAVGAGFRMSPCPYFDPSWYATKYPDVASAMEPFSHYVHLGRFEGRNPSEYLDRDWYEEIYPDINANNIDAVEHYLAHGWRELRDPSAHFSTDWYLKANSDVRHSGLCPLNHFLQYGRAEGRLPRPQMLDSDYGTNRMEFAQWRHSVLTRADRRAGKKFAVPSASMLLIFVVQDEAECIALRESLEAIEALTFAVPCIVYSDQQFVLDGLISVPTITGIASLRGFLSLRADSELALFLKAGDVVDRPMIEQLARAASPDVAFLLFDLYFHRGEKAYPLLLPGVNPALALNCDYFRSRFAAKADLVVQSLTDIARFDRGVAVAMMVGLLARQAFGAVKHVAMPLLQIPDETEAIAAERCDVITTAKQFFSYDQPEPVDHCKVSVIICTKDNGFLLEQLLRQIGAVGPRIVEIIILSNNTTNFFAQQTLDRWKNSPKIQVIVHDQPYNFSHLCNIGAKNSSGDLLLFLNDDIVPVSQEWLEDLVRPFGNRNISATGPLLLYPNERVQHGGMFLGHNNVAGHTLRNARLPDDDYMFLLSAPRNVSSLTGAALLVRRSVFLDLNGFDVQLATYLQDVDLCLRMIETGYELLFNPRATLLHMESVSVISTIDQPKTQKIKTQEFEYFTHRWGHLLGRDLFHNPNFSVTDDRLRTLA